MSGQRDGSIDPTIAMFDAAAQRMARGVDAELSAGRYLRGELFVDAVQRTTRPGGRILDYGCGTGRISLLLARAGFSVVGAEPSRELMRQSQQQEALPQSLTFCNIRPGLTDGLEKECFDTIVCSSVIEFVPDPHELLRSFHRLIAPEGRLLLSFANRSSMWRGYAEWRFGASEPHFKRQHNIWREGDAWKVLNATKFMKAQRTTYFDSPFDRYAMLRSTSRLSWLGTLGLLYARPVSDGA